MTHTTYHRSNEFVKIIRLLSSLLTVATLSANAQSLSPQSSPPIPTIPRSPDESEEEKRHSFPQLIPSPITTPSPATPPGPSVPQTTPFPPWEGTPPGGSQPGAPVSRPTPAPPNTPAVRVKTSPYPGGHPPRAPATIRQYRHQRFPFSRISSQQPSPVIEQEATEGYQLFPLEEQEAPSSSVCMLPPGYRPGERIVFPPSLGFRDVWTLFYLNKNGELCFTLPMSEGDWGTGDWFELRHPMVNHGVNIYGSYGSDIQGSVTGGNSLGFGYADCIDLRLDLDMEKLVGWKGAHLVFSGLDRNGNNLSLQHIGNQFTVAQIWGDQTINYYALWLDQNFFDGWWNIKLGRITVTDDFTSNPLIYGLYLNNGIDGQPMGVPLNGFLSAYPAAVWGTRIRFNDKKHNLYAMAGIYQTTNRLYKPAYHGLDFSIRPNDGINLIWEVGWVPEFQPHPLPTNRNAHRAVVPPISPEIWQGMLGHYKFGVFYTNWRDIPQFQPNNTFYSYGFYWLFDQMVYQAAPGTNRGLTLWTAFVYAPEQNIAKLPFQAIAGTIYTGLIPGRSKDQLALAMIYGSFSNVYAAAQQSLGQGYPTYELVLEAGYRINLSTFFYIEPDIQYVIRPGGTGRIPNALVIGAQIGFSF